MLEKNQSECCKDLIAHIRRLSSNSWQEWCSNHHIRWSCTAWLIFQPVWNVERHDSIKSIYILIISIIYIILSFICVCFFLSQIFIISRRSLSDTYLSFWSFICILHAFTVWFSDANFICHLISVYLICYTTWTKSSALSSWSSQRVRNNANDWNDVWDIINWISLIIIF